MYTIQIENQADRKMEIWTVTLMIDGERLAYTSRFTLTCR